MKKIWAAKYFLVTNFIIRPHAIISLIASRKEQTYYPDEPRKSAVRIFFDQLWQIITKGDICDDYFSYGLDRKSARKKDYVTSYWEFMQKRDYLNLSGHHNSSCLLRNKFYFGLYAQNIGGGYTYA